MNDSKISIESTRSVTFDKSLSDRDGDEGSNLNGNILSLQSNVNSNFTMGRRSQLYRRSSSVSLFSKPVPLDSKSGIQDNDVRPSHSDESLEDALNDIVTPSEEQMGGAFSEEVEVAFRSDKEILDIESIEMLTVDDPVSGFIDGNFSYGKVKDLEMPASCYAMNFNVDSTILAVGLNEGKGVAMYESQTFTLLYTLERSDTVSALDWVPNPFADEDQKFSRASSQGSITSDRANPINSSSKRLFTRSQFLAVGGFDGVVTIYEISLESLMKGVVTILCDIRVQTEVYDVAFLKDHGSLYVPDPLALVIGEMNGTISVFETDGRGDILKLKSARMIDTHKSAVLSLTFGFEADSMILVCGTKDGLIRANEFSFSKSTNEYYLSSVLFEFQRTGAIRCVKFNHDSGMLIAGGYDKKVSIIDTILWKVVREIRVDGTVNTIEFDPAYRYLMLGTRSKDLIIFDTSTLQQIKVLHASSWVTAISWASNSTVAMRSGEKTVSLIKLEAIQKIELSLISSRGEECCISWSYSGRFMARTHGNDLVIIDAKKQFAEVVRLAQSDTVRGVSFCMVNGYRDRFAMVGYDGYLSIFIMRISSDSVRLEQDISIFLEKNLCSVAWSPDASMILAGGRGMNLHIISNSTYLPVCKPIPTGGRIRLIDCLSHVVHSQIDGMSSVSIAVVTGQSFAGIYDSKTLEPTMEISRKRTVRCLCYHPSLPVLAIGDGGNNIVIVDLLGERKIAAFSVGGRVNSIDFSPAGDFIAVGSDDCTFTIHETVTFRVVQEIPAKGFAVSVSFSGISGQYVAVAHADGQTEIFKLGPLLSVELVSLEKKSALSELPEWAYKETVYRSPDGMSFLQRCIRNGSQESLRHAATILNKSPEAMLTFNRLTGMGCFESAVTLKKPNVMKLIMNTVVDGTLEGKSQLSNSMMTTTMPNDGLLTLTNMIEHHPPEFATEILSKMTFIKVPFSGPRLCTMTGENVECGSSVFTDPWGGSRKKIVRNNWNFTSIEQNRDEVLLVPAILPLPGLGTLRFLSALTSNMGPKVFDNDAMGVVLRVMWESGIKRYFWLDFTLHVAFFICWVYLVDRTASSTATIANPTSWGAPLLPWLVLGLNSFFCIEQTVRYIGSGRQIFRSLWHFVDLICIILVYIYTILIILNDQETGHGSVTLAVITTLTLTMRFVSLLRGFDRTGWLVAVLTQNFVDARGFGFIMAAILAGFTVAFRLLFANIEGQCGLQLDESGEMENDCDNDPFGSLSQSLLSTFEMTIVGSYDPSIVRESNDQILAGLTFVISVTVVLVVALNALIAVLGDSFSRVQENATANLRRERAELIVGYLAMMPRKQRKKIEYNTQYFHALLASDGHGDLLVNQANWQGGLNMLKRELTEISEANNTQTQCTIDKLRDDLTVEIKGMLQSEVSSVLNDIAMEVKGISQFHYQSNATPLNRKIQIQSVQNIGKSLPLFEGIRRNPLPQKKEI